MKTTKTKTPKLLKDKAVNPAKLRKATGLNQSEFWTPLGVTQSGGSRYEGGRNIPKPAKMLLRLIYDMTQEEAIAALNEMRELRVQQ